ncbi:hypothetical protein V2W30_16435 [Streptomyces sp. Q6]|uniref:Uncharacterized protein n=1 Tax=Streptomyces citrinus TaxID=3118173 RepID=A0ACD5AC23_9ACTN
MRHVRRGAAVLAAVGALLVACGSGESSADPAAADALRAARRHVAAAGSARVDATTDTGGGLTSRSAGTLAWSDGVEGTLTVRITGGELAASTRKLGGDPSQTRFLPDAYYTRMTDAFASLQGGRHWIRHPYDAHSDLTPADSLKALGEAKDLRRVGRETVRGTWTTHYRGTSGEQQMDVWIDFRDLLVQRTQRAGDFTSTIRYSDYGAEAAAVRPPAHDTVDFSDITSGG